ncbi:MAG: HDOD domain-containing protein [Treponema sp.]|nr:HDOD domain-containing protein [Treponema sp.]
MAKIRIAIQDEIPLTITTYTLPHSTEEYMNLILETFLRELKQEHLIEYLKYCLSELLTNSKKANTKRIYFREKNLNIFDEADYEQGMAKFKADTLDNIEHYLIKQKEAGLYVRLIMQVRKNKIKIEVRNNSEMTYEEYKRVHDKLNRAQQYTSMDQAFQSILDDSEGGGLGLIIMILMLKKVGLTEENFQVLCERGETITRIILPLQVFTNQEIVRLTQQFVKKIDELPLLPATIKQVERLIADPKSAMSDIAAVIASNAELAADLLKEINSAAYALSQPCSNLTSAVAMVGLRGIKSLLLSVASLQTLLPLVVKPRPGLREHSHRVALYAQLLARQFYPERREIEEDAYACGLLHDIGKYIFDAVHPDLLDSAQAVCKLRGFSIDVFERMVSGVTHGDLGSMIAEKWNYPKMMISVIRHHHEPDLAPSSARTVTYLVYLADFIVGYEKGDLEARLLDVEVAHRFSIQGEAQLRSLSEHYSRIYSAVSKRYANL